MADLTIIVASISPLTNSVRLDCLVYASPNHGPFSFQCEHDWDDISVNINKSIRDEAVVSAQANNIAVGPQDKKTIYGGPIDANA
jgi:hypothetical protein